jgi:hypothetical protein
VLSQFQSRYTRGRKQLMKRWPRAAINDTFRATRHLDSHRLALLNSRGRLFRAAVCRAPRSAPIQLRPDGPQFLLVRGAELPRQAGISTRSRVFCAWFEALAERLPVTGLCVYDARHSSSGDFLRAAQCHRDHSRYPILLG